jgi:hypothetical protein
MPARVSVARPRAASLDTTGASSGRSRSLGISTPETRIERQVAGHSSERRQGQHGEAGGGRPLADRPDERGSAFTSTVRGFDVDFVEMGEIVCEHLDEREADRYVVGQSKS